MVRFWVFCRSLLLLWLALRGAAESLYFTSLPTPAVKSNSSFSFNRSTNINCPHLQAGLKDWHSADTWANGSIPSSTGNVSLPASTRVILKQNLFVNGILTIPASSELIVDDSLIDIDLNGMDVRGKFTIGSETCRVSNSITITLHGSRPALVASEEIKGISVNGGILNLHGAQFTPTWSRLA